MDVSNMSVDQLIAHYQGESPKEEPQNNVGNDNTTDIQEQQTTPDNTKSEITPQSPPNPVFEEISSKLFSDDLLLPFEGDDNQDFIKPQSWEDVVEVVKANKERWMEEAKTQDKEALLQEVFAQSSPAFQFIAQNAGNFNSPSELIPLLQSVSNQDAIANIDMEDPASHEEIVRQALLIQGLDAQSVEEEIADLKDLDRLGNRAEKLKPILEKYAQQNTERILREQQEKNYEQQQFWNTFYTKLNSDLMSNADVDGLNLSKEDRALVASSLVIDQNLGGLPIYNYIDELVGQGDIATLAKIALIAMDPNKFDQYYNSRIASKTAKSLQRTLKTNLNSNTTSQNTSPSSSGTLGTSGYGVFL